MSQTTWSGPLASGTLNAGITGGPNIGLALLTQTATLTTNAGLVQNATFNIPNGAQITNIVVDVLTAYNSATSATLSVGTSSGDSTYVSGGNVETAGRESITFTAAALTAMSNVGANTSVVATVTSVGVPTTGTVVVTIHYIQKP